MLAIAGAMALPLGIVGIYGGGFHAVYSGPVRSESSWPWAHRPGEVKGDVVRHGIVLAGIGVPAGLGAAMGLSRLMSSLLIGISSLDRSAYLAAPVNLAAATVLASYLPARRAAAVDPVDALRPSSEARSRTRLRYADALCSTFAVPRTTNHEPRTTGLCSSLRRCDDFQNRPSAGRRSFISFRRYGYNELSGLRSLLINSAKRVT
jgi:hypothetical protein